MKNLIKTFSILFFFLLPACLLAQNDTDNKDGKKRYEFVKTKAINKSYNVSSSDRLNIENSFGRVEVKTWERNEIKVDVEVEVSANTEDFAQKILDRITVSDERRGKEISFKTSLKDVGNSGKGNKSNMVINYNISMPANNPLQIENEFGATVLPDYRGEVELLSKFGSLQAGNLANVKKIQVEFGKTTIGSINNGNLVIKYSNSTLGKLSGNIKMNVEFSTGINMKIDNSLSGLDIKASYSSLNLKPSDDMSASYTINTSFGSFKNRTALKFDGGEEDSRGSKFDLHYNGKSGTGSVPVKINTSFGNIILGEPGPDDKKTGVRSKSKTS